MMVIPYYYHMVAASQNQRLKLQLLLWQRKEHKAIHHFLLN